MSGELRVNRITDEAGTGSPEFVNGLAQSDIATALNASGSAPIYACRAWVNFDGSTSSIGSSGNVSSVSRTGTGQYTINFSTAMPDTNYSAQVTAQAAVSVVFTSPINDLSAGSMRVYTVAGSSFEDTGVVCVAIFR
jgi:hypothetical protein